MPKLNMVGIGPGNLEYICSRGKEMIIESDAVVGSKRQIESVIPLLDKQLILTTNKISEIKSIAETQWENGINLTILLSGDTGFYSALEYLNRNLPPKIQDTIDVTPGISSYQYLFGKLKRCWHDYILSSIHGRENEYMQLLEVSKRGIVLLTDKDNHWSKIVENLKVQGYGEYKIIVGENLSYSNEKIIEFFVREHKIPRINSENPAIIVIEKY